MRLLKMLPGMAAVLALVLAAGLSHAAQNQMKQKQAGRANIVETAKSAGEFTTLVTALERTGLAQELERGGPYTIFAPTDAAFNKLGKRKVDDLMKPENKDELAKILKYHVVQGEVTSRDLAGKKTRAQTLEGGQVSINATRGVKVNDADVTQPDIEASNGVIHAVDEVLQPRG